MLKRRTHGGTTSVPVSLGARSGCPENWVDSGYLPAIRIGRRVRIKRSNFDALLEESYTGGKRSPSEGIWDG